MRRFALFSLLLLTGCATAAGPTVTAVPRSSSVSVGGRTTTFGGAAYAFVPPVRVEAPADSVWNALVLEYGETELPVEVLTRGQYIVGANSLQLRGDLLGERVSEFLTCGTTAGIADVADSWLVQLSVIAQLTPEAGGTTMHVRVGGTADDPFTGTATRSCTTTGVLERRIEAGVRTRIFGEATLPTAAAPLPPVLVPPASAGAAGPTAPVATLPLPEPGPIALLAAGGLAGGALGTLLGSQIGSDCEKRCLNARGALGPLVANAVLVPLGVHLLNRTNGSLMQSFLVSAGWASLGAVASGLSDQDWGVYVVAPAQVITSVLIERATTGRRSRSDSRR